jgi:hypothetical protein
MDREVRDLIRKMSQATLLWGAPPATARLLNLGIAVSQSAAIDGPRFLWESVLVALV